MVIKGRPESNEEKEPATAPKRTRALEAEEIEKIRSLLDKFEFLKKLFGVINKTVFYGAIILTGMYTSRDFIGKIFSAIKTVFS